MPTAEATTLTGEEIVALCRKHTIFEWSVQTKVDPIPVERAEGVYFWTPEGKRFLDFNSQLMCTNIGHSHPKVVKAIQEQAATLAYANPFMATEAARAARAEARRDHTRRHRHLLLHERRRRGQRERDPHRARRHRAPQDPRAIPLVPRRHRRSHRAHRRSAPLGRRSRASRASCASPTSTSGARRSPSPSRRRCADIEEVIRYEGGHTIAAIIVETVVGTNGILIPPDGYMQGLRAICDKHGILLIADEVMAGFGRTGKLVRHRPLGRRARPHHHGEGPDRRRTCSSAPWACARTSRDVPGEGVPGRADLQQPPPCLRGRARHASPSTRTKA